MDHTTRTRWSCIPHYQIASIQRLAMALVNLAMVLYRAMTLEKHGFDQMRGYNTITSGVWLQTQLIPRHL